MIGVDLSFESVFGVAPSHRLVIVRSRTRAGIVGGTFWEHEEYDALGRLVARYESFEERDSRTGTRCSGWRRYDVFGRLVAEGDLPR